MPQNLDLKQLKLLNLVLTICLKYLSLDYSDNYQTDYKYTHYNPITADAMMISV